MRVAIVCPRRTVACGVYDHARKLALHLRGRGEVTFITNPFRADQVPPSGVEPNADIRTFLISGWGLRGLGELIRYAWRERPDMINFQYTPYLYHRYGMNPLLPLGALLLACSGRKIVLTVHERYVPLTNWKFWIVGWPQRFILAALVLWSGVVFVSVGHWAERLRRIFWFKRERIAWVSSPSNIDYRYFSAEEKVILRQRIGFDQESRVISVFHPLGSGKMPDKVLEVWRRVKSQEPRSRLIVIGHEAREFEEKGLLVPYRDEVYFTGYVSEKEVGELLAVTDVFLSPYEDGISSKHSSVTAAMQFALPIITTRGCLTDPLLANSPVAMADGGVEGMARAVLAYLHDKDLRERTGEAVKAFCDEHLSWTGVAERYLSRTG